MGAELEYTINFGGDGNIREPISGGIFLYLEQANHLLKLLSEQLKIWEKTMTGGVSGAAKRFRVCETGYGSGHSAAMWLSYDPRISVTSFDYFNKPHQKKTLDFLHKKFGKERLEAKKGDTCASTEEAFSSGKVKC